MYLNFLVSFEMHITHAACVMQCLVKVLIIKKIKEVYASFLVHCYIDTERNCIQNKIASLSNSNLESKFWPN